MMEEEYEETAICSYTKTEYCRSEKRQIKTCMRCSTIKSESEFKWTSLSALHNLYIQVDEDGKNLHLVDPNAQVCSLNLKSFEETVSSKSAYYLSKFKSDPEVGSEVRYLDEIHNGLLWTDSSARNLHYFDGSAPNSQSFKAELHLKQSIGRELLQIENFQNMNEPFPFLIGSMNSAADQSSVILFDIKGKVKEFSRVHVQADGNSSYRLKFERIIPCSRNPIKVLLTPDHIYTLTSYSSIEVQKIGRRSQQTEKTQHLLIDGYLARTMEISHKYLVIGCSEIEDMHNSTKSPVEQSHRIYLLDAKRLMVLTSATFKLSESTAHTSSEPAPRKQDWFAETFKSPLTSRVQKMHMREIYSKSCIQAFKFLPESKTDLFLVAYRFSLVQVWAILNGKKLFNCKTYSIVAVHLIRKLIAISKSLFAVVGHNYNIKKYELNL